MDCTVPDVSCDALQTQTNPDKLFESDICQSACPPPAKLHGIDVEIAIRKEPFKDYPKRPCQTVKVKRIVTVKPETPPKCSTRYYLKRIYELLTHRDDNIDLVKSVWEMWNSYENEAADVFIFRDVDAVASIVLVLSLRCDFFSQFQDLFDKILQRLKRGIYSGTPNSRQLRVSGKMVFFFSCIGVAIAKGNYHSQTSLATIIGEWLESLLIMRKESNNKMKCAFSRHMVMEGSKVLKTRIPDIVLIWSLEKSTLATTIASNLNEDGIRLEAYLCTLSLLKLCCDISPVLRKRLWCLRLLDDVFIRVAQPDESNRILLKSIDFTFSYFGIYNMYKEETDDLEDVSPRVGKSAIQALLQRLLEQVETPPSASNHLLGMRNDLAFIICLICKRLPFAGTYFHHYGEKIALLIVNGTLGTKIPGSRFSLDPTPDDLELLQFLIYMIKSIVDIGRGERLVRKYNLVAILLTLLNGPCGLPMEESEWGVMELQNATWSTVHAIARELPMYLIIQKGAQYLFANLARFGRTGEGDHSTLAVAINVLRTMLTSMSFSSCGEETGGYNEFDVSEILPFLIENDAMAVLILVLKRLLHEHFGTLLDTMISNVLYCCATLGRTDIGEKERFVKSDGIPILCDLMLRLSTNYTEMHMKPVIHMALSECICECIVHYPVALEEFLEHEGILRIMDILEIAARPEAISHMMNCIVLLCCDYPRCLNQLLCWKRPVKNRMGKYVFGKEVAPTAMSWLFFAKDAQNSGDNLEELESYKDLSLASLLCTLWRDNEKREEVLRDPDGCILSKSHPVMTKASRNYEIHRAGDNNEGKAPEELTRLAHKTIHDVSNLSIRPKIYLLVKSIFENVHCMASFYDGLTVSNQVALQTILSFLELKKAEVFTDLEHALERHGMSFAPTDMEEANRLLNIAHNNISAVLESQRFVIRLNKEKESLKETEFYALLKQCTIQSHLVACREVDYLARSSNYDYLVEKRLWQMRELNDVLSRINIRFTNSRIHRTTRGNLNITSWSTGGKHVESEPKYNLELLGSYEDNDDFLITANAYSSESDNDFWSRLGQGSGSTSSFQEDESSTADNMPEPGTPTDQLEGGFYQLSAFLLRKSLEKIISFRRRNGTWLKLVDEESDMDIRWKMHKKYRQDWYP